MGGAPHLAVLGIAVVSTASYGVTGCSTWGIRVAGDFEEVGLPGGVNSFLQYRNAFALISHRAGLVALRSRRPLSAGRAFSTAPGVLEFGNLL
jgi:hypothetical protein